MSVPAYDPQVTEAYDAVKYLLAASRQIDAIEWALRELGKLTEGPCAAGREPFQQAVTSALSHWDAGERTI